MAANGKEVVMHYTRHGIPLGYPFKEENVKKCESFDFRENDVLIVGYPKSGNTWLQEMTWLVQHEADIDGAVQTPIMSRVPLMESGLPGQLPYVDQLMADQGPRIMNTHLHKVFIGNALATGQPKVIVVMRNPKDLAVSYFHFYNTRPGRSIPDFNEFFKKLMDGSLMFGSYFHFCAKWWEHQNDDNFLFLTYEEMKKDHAGTVRNIAKFLGKNISEEQVSNIVQFTSFKSMQNRPNAKINRTEAMDSTEKDKGKIGSEGFFRKGEVGDWLNMMSCDQSKQIDQQIQDIFDPIGLKFIYVM